MAETPTLGLTLLDAAQAQKHVTVNEALARLDALAGRQVASAFAATPPTGVEGAAHIVGPGASGAWAGQEGRIAIWLNGGWDFFEAPAGYGVEIATGGRAVYDGTVWLPDALAVSPGGAASLMGIAETDHLLTPGATNTTTAFIPDKAIVLGVTARVVSAITGATSWDLGVAGSPERYGAGFGVGQGSYADGVSGTPLAYYGGTSLVLSAQGGSFTGGTVRLAVHYLGVQPPRAV